jgi:hypothetical protein
MADDTGTTPDMISPDTISPDTKDWTWVLRQPCAECGHDAGSVAGRDIGSLTRAGATVWGEVLTRPDARDRPAPGVWSPTEYGCHVRDVFEMFDRRLALMLAHDDPAFENWDQDATAIERRYAEQDPAVVGPELAAAAETIAARFDAVADDQWGRTGHRSDGAVFTVETLGQYFVHDWVHHLHDVGAERPS